MLRIARFQWKQSENESLMHLCWLFQIENESTLKASFDLEVLRSSSGSLRCPLHWNLKSLSILCKFNQWNRLKHDSESRVICWSFVMKYWGSLSNLNESIQRLSLEMKKPLYAGLLEDHNRYITQEMIEIIIIRNCIIAVWLNLLDNLIRQFKVQSKVATLH